MLFLSIWLSETSNHLILPYKTITSTLFVSVSQFKNQNPSFFRFKAKNQISVSFPSNRIEPFASFLKKSEMKCTMLSLRGTVAATPVTMEPIVEALRPRCYDLNDYSIRWEMDSFQSLGAQQLVNYANYTNPSFFKQKLIVSNMSPRSLLKHAGNTIQFIPKVFFRLGGTELFSKHDLLTHFDEIIGVSNSISFFVNLILRLFKISIRISG